MKKTVFAVVVLTLIVSSVFASGKGEEKSSEKVVLKIIMWTNPATVDFIEELNRKFEKKYPGIIVDMTHAATDIYEKQMRLARVTARDVDLVALQGLVGAAKEFTPGAAAQYWEQWIEAGILKKLDGQAFLKNYKKDALANASTYKGHIYTVPTGATAFTGVFYNKKIFNQLNLKIPHTFSEFVSVCEILKSNDIIPMTMAGADIWPLCLPTQGIIGSLYPDQEKLVENLWTGKASFTDERAVKVLERTKKIMEYCEEGFQAIDYITVAGRFSSGKVAMLPDGVWQQAQIDAGNPDFEYGYFLLPGSDNIQDNSFLHGKYDLSWGVTSFGNEDAAYKWLSFFSEKENYTAFVNKVGFLPTQPDIDVENAFTKSIALYPMKLAWDQVRIGREGTGQYAVNAGFNTQFLYPMGDIKTASELAEKTQADWTAAE